MALKAGYVGVKRWLYEKLQATTSKNVQDISNIRSEQAVLGARNLNATDYTKSSALTNIVPTFNSDGSITVNGATTAAETLAGGSGANFTAWYGGSVRIGEAPANVTMALYDATAGSNAGTAGQTVTMIAGHAYRLSITFAANKTFTNVTVKPLIVIASDPTTEPSAYAMTNRQLTNAYNIVNKTGVTYDATYCDTSASTASLSVKGNVAQFIGLAKITTQVPQYTKFIEGLPGVKSANNAAFNFAILSSADGTKTYRCYLDQYGKVSAHVTPIPVGSYAISFVYFCADDATIFTRSLDREASPEVIADDPEPVTKTTRSTKKTATTKEGE